MADAAPHDGATGFSCPDEVSKRVAQLYRDERLADVTFVVQKGDDSPAERFAAHRNIVSAWSRPLDRMLCGGFAEGSAREVHIRDVEPAAFEAMLKLMYCGTAEITVDNVLAILDVSVRFDVAPLVQFSVQFLQNHTNSEHACRMLEVGVQYGLTRLVDKCIELIVTDDHLLESEDFRGLSQAAVLELARHDSWNLHEDDIYDTLAGWARAGEERKGLLGPVLEHLRYPHMSIEKLERLAASGDVPAELLFDALFFKLRPRPGEEPRARYRPRPGSLLFSWVPTLKVTVSGDHRESARHTSSNGFTGIRGDRRMQQGVYSWTIDIVESQSSWIFVGIAQADDPNDVAWRSTGHMLYCLDSRVFHQGSGSNHPCGDHKVCTGDCLRVVLDCRMHTLAFGVNEEKPLVLFRGLPPTAYVPAVDLRDCGDKVRILSSNPHVRSGGATASSRSAGQQRPQQTQHLHHRDDQPGALQPGAPAAAAAEVEGSAALAAMMQQDHPHGPPDFALPGVGASQAPEGDMGGPSRQSLPAVPTAPPLTGDPLVGSSGPRRATAPGSFDAHAGYPTHAPHAPHAPHGANSSAQGNHPHVATGGNTVRTLQPRQSQGPQGGGPAAPNAEPRWAGWAAAAQDRGTGAGTSPLEQASEEEREAWEGPEPRGAADAAPPA